MRSYRTTRDCVRVVRATLKSRTASACIDRAAQCIHIMIFVRIVVRAGVRECVSVCVSVNLCV